MLSVAFAATSSEQTAETLGSKLQKGRRSEERGGEVEGEGSDRFSTWPR